MAKAFSLLPRAGEGSGMRAAAANEIYDSLDSGNSNDLDSVGVVLAPLHPGVGQEVDQIACGQGFLAKLFRRDVSSQSVQVCAEHRGTKCRQALREQGAKKSGEDVAGAASCHPRIAGAVDMGMSTVGNHGAGSFEHDDRT